MPSPVSASEVLSAMITPALLISASGTLVLSTSNRLSRVVDRVRLLSNDADALPTDSTFDAKRSLIASQLSDLVSRALILRSALAVLYMAIGFLVATSIGAGLLAALGLGYAWVPIGLAMFGACALLWGSVLLVREGRLAIASTLEEVRYIRHSMHPPEGKERSGRPSQGHPPSPDR
jgi:hypothetical protein